MRSDPVGRDLQELISPDMALISFAIMNGFVSVKDASPRGMISTARVAIWHLEEIRRSSDSGESQVTTDLNKKNGGSCFLANCTSVSMI